MSNELAVSLVALGWFVAKFVEKIYDNWRLDRAAKLLAASTATAASDVKKALAAGDEKKTAHLNAQDVKLTALAAQVHDVAGDMSDVKQQTNGLKTELVAEVRAASFAAGEKNESDKIANPPPPAGTH